MNEEEEERGEQKIGREEGRGRRGRGLERRIGIGRRRKNGRGGKKR